MDKIILQEGKKIFFLSDFHLGVPDDFKSKEREKAIIDFLLKNKAEMQVLFLLGDVFDFWFEYKKVVPKGYVRLLGTLAFLSDEGLDIRYFRGNHDFGIYNYFEKEMNMKMYSGNNFFKINDKIFCIGHGDGYGKGDFSYKLLKSVFNNKFFQKMFASIHPRWGMALANSSSKKSRKKSVRKHQNVPDEKDVLANYCKEISKQSAEIDYFIFGHFHNPKEIKLSEKSTYINTGDWLKHRSFACFDGNRMLLNAD
jgi:UDP-2,3-diacylglucosamine hydrolase